MQGFHPDLGWAQLAEGAYAVGSGVLWIASNVDLTVPTARGIAPGNGTLVSAVGTAAPAAARPRGGQAVPSPVRRDGQTRVGQTPIVIGDRLDTDIEGAVSCGADALLVLTGVTGVAELCEASGDQRPDFVSWTLQGLFEAHRCPARRGGSWALEGWVVDADDSGPTVEARGRSRDDGLRTLVAAVWAWRDEHPDAAVDTQRLAGALDDEQQ